MRDGTKQSQESLRPRSCASDCQLALHVRVIVKRVLKGAQLFGHLVQLPLLLGVVVQS